MPTVTLPVKDQQLDAIGLATALGFNGPNGEIRPWVIYGIKKANRLLAKQGVEMLIFSGRYSTPARVSAWLESHPEFVANQTLAPKRKKKKKEPHGILSHQLA